MEIGAIMSVPLLILGMFGNLHLIYATLKHKQLQQRNGILVGIIAFLHFICEMHRSKSTAEILLGKSLMTRIKCQRSVFLMGFSFNMAGIAILFLAIDRLIAVASPLK
ncbi:unnamed protein product [Gongylonema pulchrum]|uniref:G_PROTEIN_RECEP_F1_2 domain-containing protein n=1 Tax=Gongylonema pulchrum TaxID=637853 RepID=A0A183DG26_9BILA|nr:unnamed protein product [Gongylonema pulchrum]